MGAKYYPTVKDLKANQRFLEKQRSQTKTAKPPADLDPKKSKKKG
jgi:hypothetical protein